MPARMWTDAEISSSSNHRGDRSGLRDNCPRASCRTPSGRRSQDGRRIARDARPGAVGDGPWSVDVVDDTSELSPYATAIVLDPRP